MRLRRFILILASALLLAVPHVHGAMDELADQCIGQATELGSRFLKHHREGGKLEAEPRVTSCARWPGKEKWHLAVLIYDTGFREEKFMLLALIDLPNSRIVADYSAKVDADATTPYYPGSVSIDTAPYHLRPGVRAFGVEVATHNSNAQDAGQGPERTLYVREGKRIRPVLERMTMSRWEYIEGYRPYLGTAESPRPDTEEFTYTIAVAPTMHLGYADLRITRRSSVASRPPAVELLRYDGMQYPRPRE